MSEESSTVAHLSVAMTTTGMTQITGTTSSSRGMIFYFRCAVVVIGVVGLASNALVLYAIVASKQHKKHILIVNLNVLDLLSCLLLIVSYSLMLCNIHLSGSIGYWLCITLFSECLLSCSVAASVISLAMITVERYLKVVYPVWSNNNLRDWMIYLAIAFAWTYSIVLNFAIVLSTSTVIDGVCYAYTFWKNETYSIFVLFFNFLSFYVVILFIFIFCYWRILSVIRRQARVMAGHSGLPNSAPRSNAALTQSTQIQTNVIKTMILVSAFYAVSYLPNYIFILLGTFGPRSLNSLFTIFGSGYYASVFVAFLYTCTNPFIYAIKFDPVKQALLRLIPCKKTPEVDSHAGTRVNVATAGRCNNA